MKGLAPRAGLETTTLRFYEGKCQEKIFLQRAEPGKICGIQPRFAVTGGMTARPFNGNRFIADQREAQGNRWFLQPGFPSY